MDNEPSVEHVARAQAKRRPLPFSDEKPLRSLWPPSVCLSLPVGAALRPQWISEQSLKLEVQPAPGSLQGILSPVLVYCPEPEPMWCSSLCHSEPCAGVTSRAAPVRPLHSAVLNFGAVRRTSSLCASPDKPQGLAVLAAPGGRSLSQQPVYLDLLGRWALGRNG